MRWARLGPSELERHAHVPLVDRERARIVVVPILTPGVVAMTLGRWMLVRRGHEHDRTLFAHELVHVRQWRELGAVRFLAGYLGSYLRSRARGLRHWEAYRAIPFEVEARTLAGW
ncbi:MAG: DUF4157 domain-containing protein [Acidimicrobiia bacterium]